MLKHLDIITGYSRFQALAFIERRTKGSEVEIDLQEGHMRHSQENNKERDGRRNIFLTKYNRWLHSKEDKNCESLKESIINHSGENIKMPRV